MNLKGVRIMKKSRFIVAPIMMLAMLLSVSAFPFAAYTDEEITWMVELSKYDYGSKDDDNILGIEVTNLEELNKAINEASDPLAEEERVKKEGYTVRFFISEKEAPNILRNGETVKDFSVTVTRKDGVGDIYIADASNGYTIEKLSSESPYIAASKVTLLTETGEEIRTYVGCFELDLWGGNLNGIDISTLETTYGEEYFTGSELTGDNVVSLKVAPGNTYIKIQPAATTLLSISLFYKSNGGNAFDLSVKRYCEGQDAKSSPEYAVSKASHGDYEIVRFFAGQQEQYYAVITNNTEEDCECVLGIKHSYLMERIVPFYTVSESEPEIPENDRTPEEIRGPEYSSLRYSFMEAFKLLSYSVNTRIFIDYENEETITVGNLQYRASKYPSYTCFANLYRNYLTMSKAEEVLDFFTYDNDGVLYIQECEGVLGESPDPENGYFFTIYANDEYAEIVPADGLNAYYSIMKKEYGKWKLDKFEPLYSSEAMEDTDSWYKAKFWTRVAYICNERAMNNGYWPLLLNYQGEYTLTAEGEGNDVVLKAPVTFFTYDENGTSTGTRTYDIDYKPYTDELLSMKEAVASPVDAESDGTDSVTDPAEDTMSELNNTGSNLWIFILIAVSAIAAAVVLFITMRKTKK